MRQLQAQRDALMQQTQGSELIAPCDGTVLYLANATGGSVRAGNTAMVLSTEGALQIQGEYLSQALVESADEVQALVAGQRAAVEYLPMDEEEYISMLLSGGEMTTRFTFADGAPAGVQCGDYVLLLVKTRQRLNVLHLPPNALCHDATGYYVYLSAEDGGRERRDVEVGVRSSTAVEITAGLEEGDEVYVQ